MLQSSNLFSPLTDRLVLFILFILAHLDFLQFCCYNFRTGLTARTFQFMPRVYFYLFFRCVFCQFCLFVCLLTRCCNSVPELFFSFFFNSIISMCAYDLHLLRCTKEKKTKVTSCPHTHTHTHDPKKGAPYFFQKCMNENQQVSRRNACSSVYTRKNRFAYPTRFSLVRIYDIYFFIRVCFSLQIDHISLTWLGAHILLSFKS